MTTLNLSQMENLQGGDLCGVECGFITPAILRFLFLICDAHQLNGWLVADDLSPVLECVQFNV